MKTNFWSEILERNKAHIQSWISDQLEFLLQIASVAIAYAAFLFLRLIGVATWVVDILDTMDRVAAILVFALFLLSVLRRSLSQLRQGNGRQ